MESSLKGQNWLSLGVDPIFKELILLKEAFRKSQKLFPLLRKWWQKMAVFPYMYRYTLSFGSVLFNCIMSSYGLKICVNVMIKL